MTQYGVPFSIFHVEVNNVRPSAMSWQKKQVVKKTKTGGKKKKQALKFTLDCTHPVEDGIMDAANFVSSLC